MIPVNVPSTAMNPGPASPTFPSSGQILIRRIRLIAAMAVSALIFWYFGWWVASPPDPGSAVALILIDQGVVTMAELLALAAVVSGLAVAICGADSAERGPLAVAVGLATLAARAGQMDKLVLYRLTTLSTGPGAESAYPTFALIAETWLWLALIGVGLVVGRWVDSWFKPVAMPTPLSPQADPGAEIRNGAGTLILTASISWVLLSYLVGGTQYPIEKGQLYFGVAAAFLLGSLIANMLFQMQTRVMLLIVVALVASSAYIYAGPPDELLHAARSIGAYVTLAPMARPLPIEYAALGAIGILIEKDVMGLLGTLVGVAPAEQAD
ncbi:MAG: hypothetical protein KF841_03720 [Phycisphaerae bacterium]|nr:hypothetical protein [Phycisphaerae bacterium]